MSAPRRLSLLAPLSGWCLPLTEVPDPVFAEGMAGDGLAIDPTTALVLAPCEGEIVLAQGVRHAITVRHGTLEVLVHVGIDTVKLGGAGFEALVAAGDTVAAGQPLLRFDLDALARRAASLVTPLVVAAGGTVEGRAASRRIQAGEPCMDVLLGEDARARESGGEQAHRGTFRMPFDHGLHVRPAAQVAAALRPFASAVTLHFRGREANARSTVAMMSLGARRGDTLEVMARGPDAIAAIGALARVFGAMEAGAAKVAASAPHEAPRGRIEAAIASGGVALGPAVQWAQPERPVAERGSDPAGEGLALERALAAVEAHLEAAGAEASGEHRELLAGHVELVRDPELRRASGALIARGKSASFAWRAATRDFAQALGALEDPRMRERAADLRDLEMQVLRVLAGEPPEAMRTVPEGSIVLADDLVPSQIPLLGRQGVAGVCLARGGVTSHAAILASAAGLPMLVAAGPAILAIADGTLVELEGEQGWIEVEPPAARREDRQRASAARRSRREADLASAREPAVTRDGVRIGMLANLGDAREAAAALEHGAEGCGLLRTEFLFIDRRSAPGEEEQRQAYQDVAAGLQGRPLVVRTMDVGGDKPLEYLPMPREENPALGLRGLRASLLDPAILRAQLRAIARVEPAGTARVLLPMVTELEELLRVREWIAEEARALSRPMPALGVMIETPASALLAAQLAAVADFLSIGTNDLSQYTLAMDRGHPALARRLDALHPAVLRLVAATVEGAAAHGKGVSVCGALAADLDAIPILVGLGVRELSMTAACIPPAKRRVRGLDVDRCKALALRALAAPGAAAVRGLARTEAT